MVINVGNLINYETESRKVRLLSIKDNKILICNYNGFWMLPGGKIEQYEANEEALKREIKEELGIIINTVTEFVTVNTYAKDYPSRLDNKKEAKKIKTVYYTTDEEVNLVIKRRKLSDKEKEGRFLITYMNIDELINKINTSTMTDKQRLFADEVLQVINYYLKKDKLIDLHTHTNNSDGQYSTNEVIEQAVQKGISTIAITDHDTVKGLTNINYDDERITIIPGIEISVKLNKGRMHILGLGIDYNNKYLLDFLKEMKEINRFNLKNIINYLLSQGIHLNPDDIEAIMHLEKNVGRPDVAKLLIKEGYVTGVQEAFDKYLIVAFLKSRHLNKGHNYGDVLEVLDKANGISVLAHPNSLELDHKDFETLMDDMVKKGLKGLEVFHPHMSEEEREYYKSVADYYNLFISGGTDYHGEKVKPDIALGTGRDNIYITNLPILKELRKRTYQK